MYLRYSLLLDITIATFIVAKVVDELMQCVLSNLLATRYIFHYPIKRLILSVSNAIWHSKHGKVSHMRGSKCQDIWHK